jgi:hypothetical protein
LISFNVDIDTAKMDDKLTGCKIFQVEKGWILLDSGVLNVGL